MAELDALVGAQPLRESLWRLLIIALYRADRPADALTAYQRVKRHLADELGLDPGPDLASLEQQVLRHDPALRERPAGPVSVGPPRSMGGSLGWKLSTTM